MVMDQTAHGDEGGILNNEYFYGDVWKLQAFE